MSDLSLYKITGAFPVLMENEEISEEDKAKIKEDNILKKKTVVSSQGEVEGEFVKIVIEGDLP